MRLPAIFAFLLSLPSLVFSANLFEGISDYIHGEVKTIRNADLTHKNVKYSGYQVTYQYQFWKIKHPSVCANYKENLSDYSKCTIAAKKLFTDTCSVLQNEQNISGIRKQQKIMYCSSSVNFKPVIASISTSNEQESELSIARGKCNSMILQAMNTKNSSDVAKRDRACAKYKELKNK